MARARKAGREKREEPEGVRLTHPERVVYPEAGITKRGLADYYALAAPWMLPHVVGRPLTLLRCPAGRDASCFYQKHPGGKVSLGLEKVRARERFKTGEYLVVREAPGLAALVQMGALEIHAWGSTAEAPGLPDRIVFDLDPGEGVGFGEIVEAALSLRDLLASRELEAFVKTSGSKGLHVIVPVDAGGARGAWERAGALSREIALELAEGAPEGLTLEASKAGRRGKIYLDVLRNVRGATAVAPYSTRAKPNAPVSAPVSWEELEGGRVPSADAFTVSSLPARLERLDPWAGFAEAQRSLPKPRRRAA